jgi:chitodextrinase
MRPSIGLKCSLYFIASLIVTSCGGSGESLTSNPPQPPPPDTQAPSTPTGLAAIAASPTQINLSWSASSDNQGVTGYRIYRGGTMVGTVGNVTTYSNTGLTGSTTYSYTVLAIDAAGNTSNQSAPAVATTPATPDTTPPSVPSGVSATAVSSSQINVGWTASTDNVGVTGYRIRRGGALITTVGNVTSYQNTGLTASTAYSYTIEAVDAASNASGQSTVASATTLADTSPPSIPSGLSATAVSPTQINLSWSPSTDNVGVTGYRVYRNGSLIITLTNVTSYQNTGLTASTAYSYTVEAVDGAGNSSGQSTAANATTPATPDTTPPTTPTGLSATAVSSSQINLSWTASTDNVAVTGYRVRRGGTIIATLGNVTTYQNTGLAPSTNYSYTVQAIDAASNASTQSTAASATTLGDTTPPSTPTGLSANATSPTQISLAWTASTDNIAVTAYRVYRDGALLITLGSVTSYQDTGLTASTTYSYTVQALDAAVNASAQSAAAGATTPAPGSITPSIAPTRLSGVAPLAVSFDATGTTASSTSRPFHELEYRWDFGDPGGSPVSGTTWNAGSRPGLSSRNAATGPVAAHVFETPGNYTVVLNVFDGTNAASTSVNITVQDPNVVYAGTNTICFSTSGNFSGCPAGASTITTSNWLTVRSSLATNRRLLLRREWSMDEWCIRDWNKTNHSCRSKWNLSAAAGL